MSDEDKAADVNGLSDASVKCRDLKHAWEWHTDLDISENARGEVTLWTRELICLRCKAIRHDYLDSTMDRTAGRYEYPAGYLMQPGTERVTSADARREYMARVTAESNASSRTRTAARKTSTAQGGSKPKRRRRAPA